MHGGRYHVPENVFLLRQFFSVLFDIFLGEVKYATTQFDVSFSEKLLKIIATTGEIFSLKFTKYRLDPLRELKALPRS